MSTLTVCIVSTPITWENVEVNLASLAIKIKECPANSLVVLPEVFATGFTMNKQFAQTMDGTIVQWLKTQSVGKIICGSVFITDSGFTFNRFIWAQNGEVTYTYNKKHLFSLGNENKNYTAGNSLQSIPMDGYQIQPFICYDLRFPVWNRIQNTNVKMYMYVANWPETRSYAWETLLKARAIENQVFVVACNCIGTCGNGIVYDGPSGILDPMGNWLIQTNKEQILSYNLDFSIVNNTREQLPFLKDKDNFSLL